MARGDVAGSAITSVAGAGNLDFQPAAGVEVMIMAWGRNIATDVNLAYFNGTNEAFTDSYSSAYNHTVRQPCTNAIYSRVLNDSAGAAICVQRGVETK